MRDPQVENPYIQLILFNKCLADISVAIPLNCGAPNAISHR